MPDSLGIIRSTMQTWYSPALQRVDDLRRVVEGRDLVAVVREEVLQVLADVLVVVDDQQIELRRQQPPGHAARRPEITARSLRGRGERI